MARLPKSEIARRRAVLRRVIAGGGTVSDAAVELGLHPTTLNGAFIAKHAWDICPGGDRPSPRHPLHGVGKGERPLVRPQNVNGG